MLDGRARRSFWTLVLSAATLAVIAVPARAEIIDRVLAVVGGHIITESDVRAVRALGLVNTGGAQDVTGAVLAHLIERELMLEEVERYGPPEPSAETVEQRVTELEARLSSSGGIDRVVRDTGFARGRLRELVRDDLRIQSYLDQRFASAARPTDEEVTRYYEAHRGEFTARTLDEVTPLVRERLGSERRRTLIAEWVADLRRRGEVTNLYLPVQQP